MNHPDIVWIFRSKAIHYYQPERNSENLIQIQFLKCSVLVIQVKSSQTVADAFRHPHFLLFFVFVFFFIPNKHFYTWNAICMPGVDGNTTLKLISLSAVYHLESQRLHYITWFPEMCMLLNDWKLLPSVSGCNFVQLCSAD